MRKAALSFCLLTFAMPFIHAQSCFEDDTRYVTGVMLDFAGEPMAKTAITLTEWPTQTSCTVTTDYRGRYHLWLNPEASYDLQVTAVDTTYELALAPATQIEDELNLRLNGKRGVALQFHVQSPTALAPTIVLEADHFTTGDTTTDPNDGNGDGKEGDLNGGVFVTYGDPSADGGTNGEDTTAGGTRQPKMGGPAGADSLMGNRLSGTLSIDDLSSYHGLVRKLRLFGRFNNTRPEDVRLENLKLAADLVSDGNAVISVNPSPAGTFDLEIEAVGAAALNVNGTLMALDLVADGGTPTWQGDAPFDLTMIRVEPKRGRIVRYGNGQPAAR